jgi:2-succinyl-6-hydroxy-2,4-cyclohexadiene-1-carboxylate synthase
MKATRYPVLMHGFTGSSLTWGERLVDGLASAGCPPVLVDLPGHGRNAATQLPSDYSLDSTLSDVEDSGDWPADLVGYSMGGRLALHFAARRPDAVRRLVLESASPGLEIQEERRIRRESDDELARIIECEGVEAFIDMWERLPLFETQVTADEAVRARLRAGRLQNSTEGLAGALRGLGSGALPSLWEALSDLHVPTLIIVGELDRKFVLTGERMAEALPDARLVVVAGAGHAVHLERPDAWLEAVTGFLSGSASQKQH